jgi:predicted nucleic acid-binding protein
MKVVVDASVAAKWLLPEADTAVAMRLLNSNFRLHAPDFVALEVASVVWKRVRRGDNSRPEGETMLSLLSSVPLIRHPSSDLVDAAFDIAMTYGRSVYDSVYVALAVREEAQVVTADRRLYNALQPTPLHRYLCWIGDLPA